MLNYKDKTVAVIGLSERTGLAVAEKMLGLGADIIVSDIKKAEELKPQLSVLRKYDNISYDLGGHTDQILKADMIVLSPGVPYDLDILIKAEKKGIEVISEVELAYRLTEAKIIGVTGTNGKTTVTSLIGHILKNSLETEVRVGGNIGYPLISEVEGLESNDWLVTELSSFQLEKIKNFRPNIAIMINFSPDHLDRHKTVEKYWDAKYNIFSNQKEDDLAILNIDDKYIKERLNNIKAKRYEVSKNQIVENGIFYSQNYIYEVKNCQKSKVIKTSDIPLIGTHNILNTSIAVQIAKLFSIDNEIIKKNVQSYKAFAHRLEIIKDKDYTIIDDSKATNPHAAINALRSIEKPIVLILGGQDRDASFKALAYTVKQRVKKAIILGEVKDEIKKELDKIGYKNYILVNSMQEAAKESLKDIVQGDTVLLSPGCPSWDMYESYKKRGKEFQEEVKKILNSKRAGDQNE